MKRWLFLILLTLTACFRNHTNVPPPNVGLPHISVVLDEEGPLPARVGSQNFTCRFSRSIVAIYEGPSWAGSGVIIGEKTVLTAYHVVDSNLPYFAKYYGCVNNRPHRLGVVELHLKVFNKEADTAIMTTVEPIGVPIKTARPAVGAPIWIYSAARWGVRGLVRVLREDRFVAEGRAEGGDSGGAIVNSNGEVVGLIQRRNIFFPLFSGRLVHEN